MIWHPYAVYCHILEYGANFVCWNGDLSVAQKNIISYVSDIGNDDFYVMTNVWDVPTLLPADINICFKSAIGMQCSALFTLPLKSLLPLTSVRSKNTLNTGGDAWAGQRRAIKLEKLWHLSFYVLSTLCANFQQFPLKWIFGWNSEIKNATFYYPQAPFYWKLLKIGIHKHSSRCLSLNVNPFPLPQISLH